jgi:hypothetical protein
LKRLLATREIGASVHYAERYADTARAVLMKYLGMSGTQAMLFYTGVPDPDTFEQKLRSLLRDGAEIIIWEVKDSLDRQLQTTEVSE